MELEDLAVFLDRRRVALCPIRREDAPLYVKWLNHSDLSRFLLFHRPITLEQEYEILDEMLKAPLTERVNLGIWLKDPVALIGGTGFHNIDQRNQRAEVGIFIGEEQHRSAGLGSEALDLLLAYGFETLNFRKINLGAHAFNERARRSYEKLGFEEAGRLREHQFIDGEWIDSIVMEIFRDRFFEKRSK